MTTPLFIFCSFYPYGISVYFLGSWVSAVIIGNISCILPCLVFSLSFIFKLLVYVILHIFFSPSLSIWYSECLSSCLYFFLSTFLFLSLKKKHTSTNFKLFSSFWNFSRFVEQVLGLPQPVSSLLSILCSLSISPSFFTGWLAGGL